jgi:hypothetical protein
MVMRSTQGRGCGGGYALASCAALGLLWLPASAQTGAAGPDDPTPTPPAAYRLIEFPFGAGLRSPVPIGPLRLEGTALLAPRHELRFSTWSSGGVLESFPGVSLATLTTDPAARFDAARATYRYTFLIQRDWAWKLGISANMREMSEVVRPGLGPADRLRFGSRPLLHVAGEGRLASRWRLAVDADSLMTSRGRTFDLGLRVNYSLTPNFLLFGDYRMTDAGSEAEEFYGSGVSNAASFGLRYRF